MQPIALETGHRDTYIEWPFFWVGNPKTPETGQRGMYLRDHSQPLNTDPLEL